MGNSQAGGGQQNPTVPDGYFGVRVTGEAMRDVLAGEQKAHEEQLNWSVKKAYEEAFERSYSEAQNEFQGALANVASQAYASIRADIQEVHQSQVKNSINMVFLFLFPPELYIYTKITYSNHHQIDSLKVKLAPYSSAVKYCGNEEGALVICLKKENVADCSSFTSAYVACVENINR
jgi:hypothetical protein